MQIFQNKNGLFSNPGQLLQTLIAGLALTIAGRNAWKDLSQSRYLTFGAILFYALILLVVIALIYSRHRRVTSAPAANAESITALQSKLDAAVKKNEDFERSIEAIGTNLADINDRHHALFMEKKRRDALAEKVWTIKRHAREIRRRWPNSDFAWYPAAKGLWAVPPADIPKTLTDADNRREWVEEALKWHETFAGFVATLGQDVAYLNSLDFDELMESLDIVERTACGISEPHDPNAPLVIAQYDIQTTGHTRHGFNVSNVNTRTAYDVKIVPLRFGKWRAYFSDRLATLDQAAGKEFLDLSAQYPGGGVLGQDLYSLMNEWRIQEDCWGFPVPLRVIYRDRDSSWYMSTFLLEQNGGGSGAQAIICRARPHKPDERLNFVKG